MGQYLIRRLLLAIPTFIGATMVAFAMVRFMPGDVVNVILGEYAAYVGNAEQLREELGLTDSVPEQYITWLSEMLRGDFGESLRTGRPVIDDFAERLPVTLEFGLFASLISIVIALPIGILSAVKQDSIADYLARGLAIGMLSIPYFWVGVLVIVWPSVWWGWTPPVHYTDPWVDPIANFKQLIIPSAILAVALAGTLMRVTRTELLEVLRQDYVRTASAKGLKGSAVIYRHALRNAMLPIFTVIGLQVSVLISGVSVLENVFAIPGMGRYLLEAIANRDYVALQGCIVVFAVVIILTNLIVDIVYTMIDPRIRYS